MMKVITFASMVFTLSACSVLAEESPTVLAAAKVKGVEKVIDGQRYALVAVRVAHIPSVWQQMSTGTGFQYVQPTLQFDDCKTKKLPTLLLEENERKQWGGSFLYNSVLWVRFPEKGHVNVRYGLAFQGEFGKGDHLPEPLSFPVKQFPVIQAKCRQEISKAMDSLLPERYRSSPAN